MPNVRDVLSPLVGLSTAVRGWFATHDPTVNVPPVGWKQRAERLNFGAEQSRRVLFMPGLITNGDVPPVTDVGKLVQGRVTSSNPRNLWSWEVPVTMSLCAVDNSDRQNEELQIIAVTNLLELALQAVHGARLVLDPTDPASAFVNPGLANFMTDNMTVRAVTGNVDGAYGRELLVALRMKTPLFDKTYATGTATPALNPVPPRS
jgi:hypothetical protein